MFPHFTRLSFIAILLFDLSGCSLKAALDSKKPSTGLKAIPISLSHSIVTVSKEIAHIGESVTATLELKSENGTPVRITGLAVRFSVEGGTSGVSLGTLTDHQDGTYSVPALAVTVGTPVRFRASIGSESAPPSAEFSVIAASATLQTISIETKADGSGEVFSGDFRDGEAKKAYLILRDDSGAFQGNVSGSWSFSDDSFAYLSSKEGSAVRVIPHRGATKEGGEFKLLASFEKEDQSWKAESGPLTTHYTVLEFEDLTRWYKADSFLPSEKGFRVGDEKDPETLWIDHSEKSFAAVQPSEKLRPFFSGTSAEVLFSPPEGNPYAPSLQIAESLEDLVSEKTGFTVFIVATRNRRTVNGTLLFGSNQKERGIQMGWGSPSSFRLGLYGYSEKGSIKAQVPSPSDVKGAELFTGALGLGDASDLGLRLYRNGKQIASDSRWVDPVSASGIIPSLGGSVDGVKIHEVAVYSRALGQKERCIVGTYLGKKWELMEQVDCGP